MPFDPIQKVRSVRLVPLDDPGYAEAMSEQALAHRHYGPREEQAATYRVSGSVEEAVRAWLAARTTLQPERVLAAEVLYRGARTYESLFLELDAVECRDGAPCRIFEVKFTSNTAAVRRGFGQVARATRLLGARYGQVEGVVVLVQADRGSLDLDDPQMSDVTPIGAEDLARPIGAPRPLLRLPLKELSLFLGAEELELLKQARDESDANVTARHQRAAMLEAGEEPPPPPRRPTGEGATLSFGDEETDAAGDSPFAILAGLSVLDPADR